MASFDQSKSHCVIVDVALDISRTECPDNQGARTLTQMAPDAMLLTRIIIYTHCVDHGQSWVIIPKVHTDHSQWELDLSCGSHLKHSKVYLFVSNESLDHY